MTEQTGAGWSNQSAGRTAPSSSASSSSYRRSVDELLLAGQRIDGGATVEVTGLGPELDRQKGDGRSGEKIKIKGFKVAKVKIQIAAWKRSQVDVIVDLLRQHVRPLSTSGASSKDPAPIQIAHWKTDLWQIQTIIIESIDGPTLTPQQRYGITIDATEFRPPAARAYGIGYGSASKANNALAFLKEQLEVNAQIVERVNAINNGARISQAQQQHATQLGTYNPPPSFWGAAP